jgi:TolB-like protein/Flp pilus assembly protein TadD
MAEGDGEQKASGSTPRVFISYASQDAAVANSIVENLEQHGLSCWLAPRDVKPGAQYADAIVEAINEAGSVVLLLSQSAVSSSHVGREVERAASKHKPIIALRIDAAALNRALEYFLSGSQWIDVPVIGMPAALAKLTEAVGRGSVRPGAADPVESVKPVARTGERARLIAGGSLVIAVGVAAALGLHFWSHSHKAAPPAAAVAITDKSIAVLPFVDMSEKKDQEYFADGMAEEILDALAKIRGLTVIGRTSSFQFKGKNADLRTIGAQLNAAYVLEGSVRKSGDQIRITAQLINTRTGTHEWSETYDRHIGEVLKLQDAIAAAVARELQLTVAPDYGNSRSIPKSAEVYDLYLRGRHAYDRHENGGLDEAATLFQRALDRDPRFADAAVWLAWTKVLQGQFGYLAPAAAFEQARRAAASALTLDPKSAEAHAVLGFIHLLYDWDWVAAEPELQQAMTLAPGDVNVIFVEASLSEALGHWDDALRQIKAAIAQNPLDPDCLFFLSSHQANRGKLSEAETAMRQVLDIHPTFENAHYYLGLVLLKRGDRDAALLEMQQETADAAKQQGLAIVYDAVGRKAESDAALAGMLKDQADGNAVGIADVYAFRGQPDEAMHWLERAYAQKDPELYFIKSELELKSLREDPRFKAFLRKMNLPE